MPGAVVWALVLGPLAWLVVRTAWPLAFNEAEVCPPLGRVSVVVVVVVVVEEEPPLSRALLIVYATQPMACAESRAAAVAA